MCCTAHATMKAILFPQRVKIPLSVETSNKLTTITRDFSMKRNLSAPSPHGDLHVASALCDDNTGNRHSGTLKCRPIAGIAARPGVPVSSSPDLLEWYGSETLSH